MTYDEIQISALVGTSCPSFFINTGSRRNMGKIGSPGSFETEGIYQALVGARLERKDRMESNHILVMKEYNTTKAGYGDDADPDDFKTQLLRIWAKFYQCESLTKPNTFCFPTFEEVEKYYEKGNTGGRFYNHQASIFSPKYFINVPVYKKRIWFSIFTFLSDANNRGEKAGLKVYAHAVGLGLGVWQISERQAKWMMDVYSDILTHHHFPCISDLNFSWFPPTLTSCGLVKDGESFTRNGNNIRIEFSKRDPAAKLRGFHEGKLLVAMYAWDGNSFPGNEYWRHALVASGDPAAACCSTIPQLQNPYINNYLIANELFLAGNEQHFPQQNEHNIRDHEEGKGRDEEMEEETKKTESEGKDETKEEEERKTESEGKDEEIKEEEDRKTESEGKDEETKEEEDRKTESEGKDEETKEEEDRKTESEGKDEETKEEEDMKTECEGKDKGIKEEEDGKTECEGKDEGIKEEEDRKRESKGKDEEIKKEEDRKPESKGKDEEMKEEEDRKTESEGRDEEMKEVEYRKMESERRNEEMKEVEYRKMESEGREEEMK
eukprot:TRINITY_DN4148_c0_g1_i14.p1 TRINITY_DN4148_c0_g1~~TRINITY_DN4148_c0_g1_i14.p1  ORF type:complete len:551 (+),score=183.30 TRINITY_DN4148_c0_g1_i14:210-1862(+)